MANILLVDDDEQILDLLETILLADSHHIATANDGAQALVLFGQYSFDLVITDIIMPNKDGIDLIATLEKENVQTPIIAMSGGRRKLTNAQFNLDAASRMGVKETLQKPFTDIELRLAVRRSLARKK